MFDRFDYSKGRYVSYDYRPKGDRFTRGLSETPRVYVTRTNSTGHVFKRRLRTSEVEYLSVPALLKIIGPKLRDRAEKEGLYLGFEGDRLQVSFKEPGLQVRFTSTAQHKGRRLWFSCPHCGRRVGKLFVVKERFFGRIWGCQTCLGLSYPSRAAHKTPALDQAIVRGKVKVSLGAWHRAVEREDERLEKTMRRFGLFGR